MTFAPRLAVLGAGGHAKVVIDTLRAAGREVDCVFDDAENLLGGHLLGVPVMGPIDRAAEFPDMEAIIAIGDNACRQKLARGLKVKWTSAIHPSAVVSPDLVLGAGSVIFAGAVVQPGARIGAHTIVNTAATVDHDCVIGDFAHLAPGCHLGGTVEVGEGAFLGIASVVLPNLKIGAWSVLGGGGVAIHDIDAGRVAVGVPAHISRGAEDRGRRVARVEGAHLSGTFVTPDDPRWRRVLAQLPHDVYHLPEYVAVCAENEGGEALAFLAQECDSTCLIPVLARKLPADLEAPSSWCDLVSPYGYPCPVFSRPDDHAQLKRFRKSFIEAAKGLGACSVLLRLHPLFSNPTGWTDTLSAYLAHGETVYVDLKQSEQVLWQQTRKGHRGDITWLRRQGFATKMDNWEEYPEFIRLYRQTMRRLEARSSYLFPDAYFANLRAALGSKLHLCSAKSSNGQIAAAALFTAVGDIVEYHLSGSDPDLSSHAPTKLMLDAVRRWGKQCGFSTLHLGGGVSSKVDGLFQFKAGLSSERACFSTLRMIVNESRYMWLKSRIANRDALEVDLATPFFPPYRQALSSEPLASKQAAEPKSVSMSPFGWK